MKIEIVENGKWGGWIPDTIKNDKITLQFDNSVRLTLKNEDFHNLLEVVGSGLRKEHKSLQTLYKKYDRLLKVIQAFEKDLSNVGYDPDLYYLDKDDFDLDKFSKILDDFRVCVCQDQAEQEEYINSKGQR